MKPTVPPRPESRLMHLLICRILAPLFAPRTRPKRGRAW